MSSFQVFTRQDFQGHCDRLARKDPHLRQILKQYGYPPMWSRPNTFQTLILTILEQQVSLASAYAAFNKLKQRVGYVTPAKILSLSDEEMRACYFTRQKMGYARELAQSVATGKLKLRKLVDQPETVIREELKKIRGIGDWTVDIYLIHVLQRTDVFPLGDIALVNSIKHIKQLPPDTPKDELLLLSEDWKPHRTIATMMFWHAYIQRKGIRVGV